MTMLISDKTDFKTKSVTRDKEGYFIIINRSIHQEDLKIINVNGPNNKATKCMKG